MRRGLRLIVFAHHACWNAWQLRWAELRVLECVATPLGRFGTTAHFLCSENRGQEFATEDTFEKRGQQIDEAVV